MSGHSKWASIKHKKAIVDAKKGKIWTKIANMITVAARESGGDIESNFKLRLSITKAKESNMPKENIDRAIKRGAGGDKSIIIEEIRYEGYGPGGIAVMVNATTDNRNRTASEVRAAFSKHNGKLGETGSVGWMFDEKGQIFVDFKGKDKDESLLFLMDSGAEDIEGEDDHALVITSPKDFEEVTEKIKNYGLGIVSSEVSFISKNEVKVSDEKTASQILKLIDALEEIDDVMDVVSNYEIAD
ncbi:YebC/PmpR family DNA-binding transcriptional regulator [bacterium (Candidatus Howlettbacteria) CG_4_9_14_3_um_filter_37_10]|nr:MAG: YebC/PmpR family DNA-binding transcriptional regulator [bacterium (Candidatus Howlettbacteria) CG_4_9_14_3_um_filter_37_10]